MGEALVARQRRRETWCIGVRFGSDIEQRRESGDNAVTIEYAARRRVAGGMLEPRQLLTALPEAFRKLDPRTLYRNPVMFVTEVGAVLTTAMTIADPTLFGWLITLWLWLTPSAELNTYANTWVDCATSSNPTPPGRNTYSPNPRWAIAIARTADAG
ncbi:hypothetical protein [Nocardia sp. NPDC051570]|uniref:hypothetical protein n=1 Tax=Nocardia sp. NPDC051570 TaxID=3364324 RepID=UPI0037B832EC